MSLINKPLVVEDDTPFAPILAIVKSPKSCESPNVAVVTKTIELVCVLAG